MKSNNFPFSGNKPGSLSAPCRLLAKAGITSRLAPADTREFASSAWWWRTPTRQSAPAAEWLCRESDRSHRAGGGGPARRPGGDSRRPRRHRHQTSNTPTRSLAGPRAATRCCCSGSATRTRRWQVLKERNINTVGSEELTKRSKGDRVKLRHAA